MNLIFPGGNNITHFGDKLNGSLLMKSTLRFLTVKSQFAVKTINALKIVETKMNVAKSAQMKSTSRLPDSENAEWSMKQRNQCT